jgi:hypothetical protein
MVWLHTSGQYPRIRDSPLKKGRHGLETARGNREHSTAMSAGASDPGIVRARRDITAMEHAGCESSRVDDSETTRSHKAVTATRGSKTMSGPGLQEAWYPRAKPSAPESCHQLVMSMLLGHSVVMRRRSIQGLWKMEVSRKRSTACAWPGNSPEPSTIPCFEASWSRGSANHRSASPMGYGVWLARCLPGKLRPHQTHGTQLQLTPHLHQCS